ncbi:MAG: CCA tRNA nucleotidyltransferase [Azospirillaceae bacterium]
MTGPASAPASAEQPVARLDPVPESFTAPRSHAVLDALAAAGGAARFVGGCVRNALIDRPAGDIDIATTLAPDAVVSALEAAGLRAVPTGIDHGTVTAVSGGVPYEITTLRRDVGTDGRHATVAFTTDWAADAARRDFTMNALYADGEGRVFDPVGGGAGVADARAGRVRFVGDPATRLAEDYLRLLRFFRFLAQYGRETPDATTLAALAEHVPGLARLSGERLRQELVKLLAAPDPVRAWRLMAETGAAAAVIGEAGDIERLAGLLVLEPAPDWVRRLAALMTEGPQAARSRADRLRLSNAERDRLGALTTPAPEPLARDADALALRRWLYRQGVATGRDRLLIELARAPDDDPRRSLVGDALAFEPPRLPVTGDDAIELGAEPGPALGVALRDVEDWWVARDFAPDRAACKLELARRLGIGDP